MLKRIICAGLTLCIMFSLTACKKSSHNDSVTSAQQEASNENANNSQKLKEQLDFGGEEIVIMRKGENTVQGNFNKRLKETEKKFNVKIVEKIWTSTLAADMLAGVKPEGHLYLIGADGGGNIIDLATKGYLASLNQAMKDTGITMQEEIYNEFNTQHSNINGKQWSIGVGFARINSAILYNKKLTKAAGYDIEKLVKDKKWTWSKMTEIGKKLTKRNNSGEVTQWGIGMAANGIKGLILSNGGNIIYPNGNGKFVSTLETENVQEALQLAYDWYYVDKIANPFNGGKWTQGATAFTESKMAMYFTGHTGITTAYDALSGDDYGVAYLPMGPKMDKYVSYMVCDYSYVIPVAYQNMTTDLLLLVDELHQLSAEGNTRNDEFKNEWRGYFHTSQQYKTWYNMHFSDDVERRWEGLDLVQTTFDSADVLGLDAIINGTKTPTAWINTNLDAYNVIATDKAKSITYTGKLQ